MYSQIIENRLHKRPKPEGCKRTDAEWERMETNRVRAKKIRQSLGEGKEQPKQIVDLSEEEPKEETEVQLETSIKDDKVLGDNISEKGLQVGDVVMGGADNTEPEKENVENGVTGWRAAER